MRYGACTYTSFGMSMELAAIATIVVLIVYLLYFRFAPKTGILLILTPLLFYIKIPYIIPVIAALTVGMTGIVPVVCGIFMYYMINFASRYSTAISSMDADSAVQNITFILIIYLITKNLLLQLYHFNSDTYDISYKETVRKLFLDYRNCCRMFYECSYSHRVISLLSIKTNVLFVVIGTVLAIVIGLVLHLFIFLWIIRQLNTCSLRIMTIITM